MIKIDNLTFFYNSSQEAALRGISLKIQKGEFVGIVGPTGAGKTTLSLCMNGVIPHFEEGSFHGKVLINEADTVDSNCALLAYSIGSVFQDPEAQIVSSSVEEEIAFGLENLNIPCSIISDRINECLKITGISDFRYANTAGLSGGQKQRVAIAAAIALHPSILVLDEPTSELDPQGSIDIFDTLKNLNAEHNTTIIVVEQKMQLLSEYCSRIIVMDKGQIALDGPTRQVLGRQDVLEALGVNCAPVTQLAYLLRQQGIYKGEIPVNLEEAFLVVSKVLSEINAGR